MSRIILLALMLVAPACTGVDTGAADAIADGQLDLAFGAVGMAMVDRVGVADFDEGQAVALQSDGKIVLAGHARIGFLDVAFGVTRLQANGALDTTFGARGWVLAGVPGSSDSRARAVAIQKDGKIVVAGSTKTAAGGDVAIVRLNSDGSLDRTFGSGGWVITDVGGEEDVAYAVALQGDAKILAAGHVGGNHPDRVALARYNVDGSLDRSFDDDGRVTSINGAIRALCVQSDGRIVAVGESFGGAAVLRYRSDGRLDPTFGTGGVVEQSAMYLRAAALQADGRIVVTGGNAGGLFVLARYKPDGTLDATFGTGGRVITDFGPGAYGQEAVGVALQADGKIVIAGSVTPDAVASSSGSSAIVRYDANGMLDASFGTNGKVLRESTSFLMMKQMVLQPDGDIVTVGTAVVETTDDRMYHFAVMRYLGSRRAP